MIIYLSFKKFFQLKEFLGLIHLDFDICQKKNNTNSFELLDRRFSVMIVGCELFHNIGFQLTLKTNLMLTWTLDGCREWKFVTPQYKLWLYSLFGSSIFNRLTSICINTIGCGTRVNRHIHVGDTTLKSECIECHVIFVFVFMNEKVGKECTQATLLVREHLSR